jgi:hypothetical protein
VSLTFPNQSRSYDADNRRIRFSGYDGMFEIRFFLQVDALTKGSTSKISDEREILSAFDALRNSIVAVAEKVYGKRRKQSMCTLTASDFS